MSKCIYALFVFLPLALSAQSEKNTTIDLDINYFGQLKYTQDSFLSRGIPITTVEYNKLIRYYNNKIYSTRNDSLTARDYRILLRLYNSLYFNLLPNTYKNQVQQEEQQAYNNFCNIFVQDKDSSRNVRHNGQYIVAAMAQNFGNYLCRFQPYFDANLWHDYIEPFKWTYLITTDFSKQLQMPWRQPNKPSVYYSPIYFKITDGTPISRSFWCTISSGYWINDDAVLGNNY